LPPSWPGLAGWPQRLEALSQERFWRGQHLVATRNSVYGSLAVVGTEGSRTVYENGVVLFNVPDPPAAEEAVHYALLEHPSPRSLLLIGGGLNGSIEQALRQPTLQRVDYVELDPVILDLAREYFPNASGWPCKQTLGCACTLPMGGCF
jgi:spermidine synthase